MNYLRNLIRQIHRRSLWQVLGIYVVASWAVLQVVDTIGGALNLPDWFPSFAFALLLVGLPIVLATAFVQEGGPISDGEPAGPTREEQGASTRLLTWRNAFLGGLGAFALWGIVAAGWLLLGTEVMGDSGAAEAQRGVSAERSVAVLPFVDLSPESDQEWFSDGITEELLNALTQLRGLHVPARHSSFAFKDEGLPIAVIADSLGVAHVVTGSVRRTGDRVRIGAQLVDAGPDRQIWAESYDRRLSPNEVFAIQEEIARAIVDRLQVELGGEEIHVAEGTESQDAYDLYLRARSTYASRRSVDDVDMAISLYERAIEEDSGYAVAHAGLAEAWAVRPNYGGDWGADLSRADQAANMALSIDPAHVRARLVLANVRRDRWEWNEAERLYRIALQGLPDDSETHHEYGEFLLDVGRCDEAEQEQRRALETDPLSGVFRYFLAMALLCQRRIDEADGAFRRAAQLGFFAAQNSYPLFLLEAGRIQEAAEYIRTVDFGDRFRWYRTVVDGAQREVHRVSALEGEIPTYDENPNSLWAIALLGDREEAIRRLEAYAEQGHGVALLIWMPAVQRLLGDDPRFEALLEEIGIAG